MNSPSADPAKIVYSRGLDAAQLEKVNQELREMTPMSSPEPVSYDDLAREFYEAFLKLGGVPARPLKTYPPRKPVPGVSDDVDEKEAEADEWKRREEYFFWQYELTLWERFLRHGRRYLMRAYLEYYTAFAAETNRRDQGIFPSKEADMEERLRTIRGVVGRLDSEHAARAERRAAARAARKAEESGHKVIGGRVEKPHAGKPRTIYLGRHGFYELKDAARPSAEQSASAPSPT